MVRAFLKYFGLLPYLKLFRERYMPSADQKHEKSIMPVRLSFYQEFIEEGDLCFDIGANIGNRTQVFLALGARVVAVEPQKECAKLLELRFGNRINLVNRALGKKEGVGEIFISETSEISSLSREWISEVSKTRFKDKRWSQSEQVQLSTLDKLIDIYGVPKFCKIDVEGFEEEVLMGLSQPIPIISFEYTVPERFTSINNCLDRLTQIGEFECNYTMGEIMKLESDSWISKEALINRMDELSTSSLFGDIYIRFKAINKSYIAKAAW